MYVLIRSRVNGIINDVEVFSNRDEAILYAQDNFTFSVDEKSEIEYKLDKTISPYENGEYIVTLIRILIH